MAVEISNGTTVPHATNYSDLLAKLISFITANGWTSIASVGNEEYFKGSGGGSDQIFVGIQKYADAFNDNYAWIMQGLTGYVPGLTFHNQPGAIAANPPALALWNFPIPYWFIVSPRRIIVVAKVSSLYMTGYMGWLLPYAIPASQWPYPHCIGGNTYAESSNSLIPLRYSDTSAKNSEFYVPYNLNSSVGQLCLRDPSGTWQRPLNKYNQEAVIYNYWDGEGVWPWNNRDVDEHLGWDEQEKTLDGNYMLQPGVIHLEVASRNVYGEFDSLYHVSGRGQSAENIIVRGGIDHLVVQNVFRTAKDSYAAIKLA